MTNFIYLSSFRIFALVTSSYNISVYAKMQGIYLLLGPSKERFFASKSHFARHFLSGRFQHFCMAANHSTDPYRYKNVKWPILYIYRHSAFLHLLWFADGSSSYVKMQGIYLLLKTLQRTTLASKSHFARHFHKRKISTFLYVSKSLHRAIPLQKCEMTYFIYIH